MSSDARLFLVTFFVLILSFLVTVDLVAAPLHFFTFASDIASQTMTVEFVNSAAQPSYSGSLGWTSAIELLANGKFEMTNSLSTKFTGTEATLIGRS